MILYLALILKTLKLLFHSQEKIMAQIDDLNTAIIGIQTDVSAITADVAIVLQLLKDAQSGGADLTEAITRLEAVHTGLSSVDSTLKAVEPTPPTT